MENKLNRGIFSESTLKTSFYEELQKNGWCDIVDDKPDNLTKMVQIKIGRSRGLKRKEERCICIFQYVELHRKCRVVTIRKKLIKLHIKLTKD